MRRPCGSERGQGTAEGCLLQPVDRFGPGHLALIGLGAAAGQFGASVGDRCAHRVLPGLGRRGAAIAASVESHAHLTPEPGTAKTREHDVNEHQSHKSHAKPDGLPHEKKFPILRNFV